MGQSDTIFAPATAAGRAGVAVLRISGPAAAAAAVMLGTACPAPRHAQYCALRTGSDGDIIDHALLLFFAKPHSFTGEDVLEIQCHGSPAVMRALIEHLGAQPGFRLAEAGEFTRRAYLQGKMDLTAAEGLADLIQAETDAQRRQALRQLSGRHRVLFESLRQRVMHVLALLEACIDFSDEDIPTELAEQVAQQTRQLHEEITRCLSDWQAGERVREGWQVAILGLPNAGKSSLLNALSKREAAIVSPQAGTTRDVIEVSRVIHGHAITFLDTAGLREAQDDIEAIGVQRAVTCARQADLHIMVSVAGEATEPTMEMLARQQLDIDAVPTLWVANKEDLLQDKSSIAERVDGQHTIFASAKHGEGIEAIEHWIAQHIETCMAGAHPPLITRMRHRSALSEARLELESSLTQQHNIELQCEHLRRAGNAVGSITGSFTSDDLLGMIFSEFCIGK